MLGQPSLPDEETSIPLQVESGQAALAQDVFSGRCTQCLWTGLGFSVLMLIGVSACTLHPLAAHASSEPSHIVPEFAFSLIPGNDHARSTVSRAAALLGFRPESIPVAQQGMAELQNAATERAVAEKAGSHPKPSAELDIFERLSWFDDHVPADRARHEPSSLLSRSSSVPAMRTHRVRSPVVMSAAVLERPVLQRAPPAPPPPGNSGGGGGGGGGGDTPLYLRLVQPADAVELFDDWISREGVYIMSGQFGDAELATAHRKALGELEPFRLFCQNEQEIAKNERKMIFGLYSHRMVGDVFSEKLWALAAGSAHGGVLVDGMLGTLLPHEPEHRGNLVIKHISVNPTEVNDKRSAAASLMSQGLLQLQKELGIEELVMP